MFCLIENTKNEYNRYRWLKIAVKSIQTFKHRVGGHWARGCVTMATTPSFSHQSACLSEWEDEHRRVLQPMSKWNQSPVAHYLLLGLAPLHPGGRGEGRWTMWQSVDHKESRNNFLICFPKMVTTRFISCLQVNVDYTCTYPSKHEIFTHDWSKVGPPS